MRPLSIEEVDGLPFSSIHEALVWTPKVVELIPVSSWNENYGYRIVTTDGIYYARVSEFNGIQRSICIFNEEFTYHRVCQINDTGTYIKPFVAVPVTSSSPKTVATDNGIILEWPSLDDCVDFNLVGGPYGKCECGATKCSLPYHYDWCPAKVSGDEKK